MVDLIESLQQRGLTRGLLALKHRKSVTAGETHRFIVPVLGVDESMEALASGAAQLGAADTPALNGAPALAAGEARPSPHLADEVPPPPASPAAGSDDDVVDAELVDEPLDIVGVWQAAKMSPSKALVHARHVAEKKGLRLPNTVEEITGDLARAVANDLAVPA